MGDIIDVVNVENIYRCNHVKKIIIFINLIGSPITFILLLFVILRIIFAKKQLAFLTKLILLIFASEIINTISKMIQLIKYRYEDLRSQKDFDSGNTPRGIICQIQITTAIYSDFCSLLTTLLISLRCYDVIKNMQRFFEQGNREILSIILSILISIILSIGLLFIDKFNTSGNISYRFDVRDRCSYWCWLDHLTSLICFLLYWILIFLNIFFTCKTSSYLKKGYQKLLEDKNINLEDKNCEDMNAPLKEESKEDKDDNNNSKNDSYEEEIDKNTINNLTKEEKKRIEELRLMRIKCLVYPSVTIIIWLIMGTYRTVDDIVMMNFDKGTNTTAGREDERQYFEEHPTFQFFVQFFLVLHSLLSSIRGIFYVFCFITFEEQIFNNFFRKYCFKSLFKDSVLEENDEEKKEIINNSTISESNKEENENQNNESKNETAEMNNSDYQYIENE